VRNPPYPKQLVYLLTYIVGRGQKHDPEMMDVVADGAEAIRLAFEHDNIPYGMRIMVCAVLLLDAITEFDKQLAAETVQ